MNCFQPDSLHKVTWGVAAVDDKTYNSGIVARQTKVKLTKKILQGKVD